MFQKLTQVVQTQLEKRTTGPSLGFYYILYSQRKVRGRNAVSFLELAWLQPRRAFSLMVLQSNYL